MIQFMAKHNLFLTPVNEEEVIGVVKIWEIKTSTDYENISMTLVKKLLTVLQNLLLIFVTYLSALEYSQKNENCESCPTC